MLPFTELRVNTMPSNMVNIMEGNAILNQSIEVWGSATGGAAPYNFQLFVDDELIHSGSTNSGRFIGTSYAFHTLGKRKVKLIVSDASNDTDTSESVIRVHLNPMDMVKVNMRIEKGLLFLYKNYQYDSDYGVYWEYDNNKTEEEVYIYGTTAAATLAFEEKGHLANNDFYSDPYAQMVSECLRFLLTRHAGQLDIDNHNDGIQLRISDLYTQGSGEGKGSFLVNVATGADYFPTYANAFGLMAIILSQHSAGEAQSEIIPYGYFQNWSYYDLIQDAFDLLYWNQGDYGYRGGWRRMDNDATSYDGSTQQWPILAMKAAQDRWGLYAPQWVKDNAMHAYYEITNVNGGCGYSDSGGSNTARTGGKLAGFAWADKYAGLDNDVNQAMNYVIDNYLHFYDDGWAGCFYAMYAKKD